jgi:hypothetical protein
MYNSDNLIIPDRNWYNPIIEISLLPMYATLGLSMYVIVNATGIETLCAIVYLIGGGYMYSKAIKHIYAQ